ncbi:MAG: Galactose mutarotase related enzyme [Clostridiales bacterium]|jgi:galactose mutarotase-like enzyme|nr:Galactose mutarotase related enzyme [Clostridiales bacterium]
MNTILENKILKIQISEKGAELTSLVKKKNNSEYIWQADPKYWGRHAPILFPIVGKVKNNKYKIGNKEYSLNQHGFARDLNFNIKEKCSNSVLFILSWSEETLKVYPYKFELYVKYQIQDSKVDISYTVKNQDDCDIYFSIGSHPGFNCPMDGSNDILNFEDYYFEFDKVENTDKMPISSEGLIKRKAEPYLENTSIIKLSKELFASDAIVFENLKSNTITLKNNKNKDTVTVDFTGFPYLGLWSKPGGAPFVCIEPWFGHADYEDFDGDFREKEGVLKLGVKEGFSCKYSISI